MTVAEADEVLARLQSSGLASRDDVDEARRQREEAVRRAVGAKALARLAKDIERCVDEGDDE